MREKIARQELGAIYCWNSLWSMMEDERVSEIGERVSFSVEESIGRQIPSCTFIIGLLFSRLFQPRGGEIIDGQARQAALERL